MVLFFLGTAQTLRICFFGNPRSNSIAKKFGAYHSSHPSSVVCDAFFSLESFRTRSPLISRYLSGPPAFMWI